MLFSSHLEGRIHSINSWHWLGLPLLVVTSCTLPYPSK
uniref:Uncharacterized protein n=1 Tax=Utricularia reniformis TaxID=192314 RepID=A0A1Y0B460_9LAMI|nr:hypothetical protein AEK19_MT1957 [Utricularia reniformis]ART32119.1 hypothetical protein AEK19_MT1957 [Utricularia reniformis]